jgi:hypothetical protein
MLAIEMMKKHNTNLQQAAAYKFRFSGPRTTWKKERRGVFECNVTPRQLESLYFSKKRMEFVQKNIENGT